MIADKQRPFFGTTKKLIERLDSLDESWYVEIWLVKYYFFGIEVYSKKKEIVKRCNVNARCAQ